MPRGRPLGPATGPFPNGLRSARVRAGLSQGDIAKILGVSYVQVGRIERGLSRLSTEHVLKLGSLIANSPAELLTSPRDRLLAQLLAIANRMTVEKQQQWLAQGERLLVGRKRKGKVLHFPSGRQREGERGGGRP